MTEYLQPTVLLYGMHEPRRLAAIRAYLRTAGIRALEVPDTDWEQSLGALLELPGFARSSAALPGPEPREEMLVMFAFRGQMLGELLQFFRDRGLRPVSLKAMVTDTNVCWSGTRLQQELRLERVAIESAKKREPI